MYAGGEIGVVGVRTKILEGQYRDGTQILFYSFRRVIHPGGQGHEDNARNQTAHNESPTICHRCPAGVISKLADLTVLSRDIMTIPAEEILKTVAVITIVGGEVVYRR